MINMTEKLKSDDGFTINVYSPGNLIAKTITIEGDVYLGGDVATGGFSDEQIAQALKACVGKGPSMSRSSVRGSSDWSWISPRVVSAPMRASVRSVRSRLWTTTPTTWIRSR